MRKAIKTMKNKILLIIFFVLCAAVLVFYMQPHNKDIVDQANNSSQNITSDSNETVEDVNATEVKENKTDNSTAISIPLERPPFI